MAWIYENVNFVPEEINRPNVPQARPIENFWSCLAQKTYKGAWGAKTEQQLIRRIESKMKEFDTNVVESLLEGVKSFEEEQELLKCKKIKANEFYLIWLFKSKFICFC